MRAGSLPRIAVFDEDDMEGQVSGDCLPSSPRENLALADTRRVILPNHLPQRVRGDEARRHKCLRRYVD